MRPIWKMVTYAALPLVLWAVLPGWAVLTLSVIYGLAVQWIWLHTLRPVLGALLLLLLYLPGMLGTLAAGGWLIDLLPTAGLLMLGGLALWLVEQAAQQAEEKGSRAWLYLLVLTLLAPHPLALLSLGAALLLRRGADDVALEGGGRPWLSAAGLRLLTPALLVAASAVLLSFALPGGSLLGQAQASLWQAVAAENPALAGGTGCEDANWTIINGEWVSDNGCVVGGDSPMPQEDSLDTASPLVAALGNVDRRLLALLGLALAAGLWWRSVARRPRPPEGAAAPDAELQAAAAGPLTAPPPLHRVRAAYARTEAQLAGLGLTRQDSETPAEYLRRAASRWPDLAASLAALSGAYAPVRYGSGVTNAQADAAEAAAHAILNFTSSTDSLASAQD